MSAPFDPPRTPAPSSVYTDWRWDPSLPGLRSDTCAAGEPGVAGGATSVTGGQPLEHPAPHFPGGYTIAGFAPAQSTITPPLTVEPASEPHPADHRLAAAEHALIAIRRQALAQAQDAKATAEWATNALHHIRKARGR